MDASYFHKPWIERLLSTFDPQSVTSESQESLVGQVMSVELTTDQSDGVEIAGKGELHDNHLYVNAMFTQDAVQRFEEEECEEGCSGAEFGDLKNSIITLKKYHIIPHLDDQKKRQLLVCVEYFTLCHFDALPRVSRQPLIFASQKKSVADSIRRLCSKRTESYPEPEAISPDNTNSFSEPHLTQLLEEINKVSPKEGKETSPKRTFVFELTPSRHMADSNSEETDEDIQILCDALSQMERKLSIAKKLHHLLENSSAFTVEELPSDIHGGLMADFDYDDFEVPEDVLKQLETIEEWRPDYVKPSSVPSNSSSADMNDMRGGGASSSVEKRTDNEQTGERVSPSQTESEAMFLGIDDSMESIGLSTEEMLLADSQTENTPFCIESVASKTPVKKACEKDETSASKQQVTKTNDLESNMPIKRKRIPTSEDVDSPNKILRQNSPGDMNCRLSNNRHSDLDASNGLSPISGSHGNPPSSSQYLQTSKMIQNRNVDSDRCIWNSINLESAEGSVGNAVASETVQDKVVDAGIVNMVTQNDWEPDFSVPDLFEQTEDQNSCGAETTRSGEDPACQSSLDTNQNEEIVSAKKQTKTVHFKDSVCEDYHGTNQDKQDCAIRPSVTQQNKVMSTYGDDSDSSVEILNTSVGFQPVDFYTTPQTVDERVKRRPIAKLRSPQIPCSVETPVNSLPSHQPRHLLSSLITSSQSSVSSSSHTVKTEVDPFIEELSNIKLEEQILEWCTSHFIDMRNLARNQKNKKKVR